MIWLVLFAGAFGLLWADENYNLPRPVRVLVFFAGWFAMGGIALITGADDWFR